MNNNKTVRCTICGASYRLGQFLVSVSTRDREPMLWTMVEASGVDEALQKAVCLICKSAEAAPLEAVPLWNKLESLGEDLGLAPWNTALPIPERVPRRSAKRAKPERRRRGKRNVSTRQSSGSQPSRASAKTGSVAKSAKASSQASSTVRRASARVKTSGHKPDRHRRGKRTLQKTNQKTKGHKPKPLTSKLGEIPSARFMRAWTPDRYAVMDEIVVHAGMPDGMGKSFARKQKPQAVPVYEVMRAHAHDHVQVLTAKEEELEPSIAMSYRAHPDMYPSRTPVLEEACSEGGQSKSSTWIPDGLDPDDFVVFDDTGEPHIVRDSEVENCIIKSVDKDGEVVDRDYLRLPSGIEVRLHLVEDSRWYTSGEILWVLLSTSCRKTGEDSKVTNFLVGLVWMLNARTSDITTRLNTLLAKGAGDNPQGVDATTTL